MQRISRRALIANGAAGTAGALGLACNTKLGVVEGEQPAQPARSQDPPARQGTRLFQKVKPFLAQRFSTDPPPRMRGTAKFAPLHAWACEQLAEHFNPRENHDFQGTLDPGTEEVFNSIQRAIEDQILASQVWSQQVEPNQPVVVYPADRDKYPGTIPPPPPPPPPPGDLMREASL